MRRPRSAALAAGCVALVLGAVAVAWTSARSAGGVPYMDIPASFGFPTDDATLEGYVLRDDQRAIRRHGWQIWAGLTSPSQARLGGRVLPVWETWFSVPEVFTRGDTPVDGGPRGDRVDFVRPHQDEHARDLFGNRTPAVLSFVRYDRAAGLYIRQSGSYLQRTLDAAQARFNRKRTPTEERSIQPFPNDAASLKVVFWLVDRKNSPTHPDGMTVFPYWDPNYPRPPGGQPPRRRRGASA